MQNRPAQHLFHATLPNVVNHACLCRQLGSVYLKKRKHDAFIPHTCLPAARVYSKIGQVYQWARGKCCRSWQSRKRLTRIAVAAACTSAWLLGQSAIVIALGLVTCEKTYAVVTVGELSELQSEIILLQAKLKQVDLQAELFAKNQRKRQSAVTLPVLQAVYGVGRERYASFMYDTGMVLEAKPGDLLPGGFTVVSIQVNQVLLHKGSAQQNIAIGFAATPFSPSQAASTPTLDSQALPLEPSMALPATPKHP